MNICTINTRARLKNTAAHKKLSVYAFTLIACVCIRGGGAKNPKVGN